MLIGEFAERTGLSQRTVRHYDEIHILQASGRSESGYRIYAPADLDRARIIRSLRALSLTHPEIKDALATLDLVDSDPDATVSTIRRELSILISDIEARECSLREQVRVASGFVELLRSL
ncbi:MerR family transcriptional regulator [Cryobacterium sp. M91]|uniref:MerR family transcriptional regulator n=1 Tax=Cryobacterium sp. M91 TaxID=2048294 RepID=UPI0011B008ED|nr:MerR family transcriptional regulator [Cryobacterium sp. M91]